MAVEITSREELEAWLEDKPRECAQVIALRSALRVFPIIVEPRMSKGLKKKAKVSLAALQFRCLFAASVQSEIGNTVLPVFDSSTSGANVQSDAQSAGDLAIRSASKTLARVLPSATAAIAHKATAHVWGAVERDCRIIDTGAALTTLMSTHIWIGAPDWWDDAWDEARKWLSASGQGFEIWREWYHGRIEGLPHAFADFDDAADEKFYRWIVEQADDWWSREPAEVNAEITEFVNALRQPKAPPPDEKDLVQNPSVGTYLIDEQGRSVLAPEPLPNGLSDDPDTHDAFDEIRRLAREGVAASDPLRTQAPEFGKPAGLLADACGESLDGVSPVKFVIRGKALVKKVEGRIDGSLMGPPLSEEQEAALAPLAEAIKLAVKTEPKLFDLWHGDFEVAKPVLTAQQINIAIEIAGEAGQTVEEADADLKDAASVIPDDAGEDNAERKTASEKVTNFFRSIAKPFKWADGILTPTGKALKIGERFAKHWPKLAETFQNNPLIKWIIELFTN